jgi:hypothetical protein
VQNSGSFFVITIPILICVCILLFTNVSPNIYKYANGYFSSLKDAIKEALPQPRSRGTIHKRRELLLPLFHKKKS